VAYTLFNDGLVREVILVGVVESVPHRVVGNNILAPMTELIFFSLNLERGTNCSGLL
jgi:hypothetical protein